MGLDCRALGFDCNLQTVAKYSILIFRTSCVITGGGVDDTVRHATWQAAPKLSERSRVGSARTMECPAERRVGIWVMNA